MFIYVDGLNQHRFGGNFGHFVPASQTAVSLTLKQFWSYIDTWDRYENSICLFFWEINGIMYNSFRYPPIVAFLCDSCVDVCFWIMLFWYIAKVFVGDDTFFIQLIHWGRVTHICVSKLTIIGPDNGLSPGRRQAIVWTNEYYELDL